jgi:subtilisin family serine protease
MRLSLILSLLLLTGCFEAEKPPEAPKKHPAYRHVPARQLANSALIKIAVIDTGFGFGNIGHSVHLCKYGHKDFTTTQRLITGYDTKDPVPLDEHGHGTNIAGIIDQYAGDQNFCLVILKYFTEKNSGPENLRSSNEAIKYAKQIGVDVINYSGGGVVRSVEEELLIKGFLDGGGTFVAAAGNEGINSDFFHFYPADYDDRIVSVGALKVDIEKVPVKERDENMRDYRTKVSNYGKSVKRWELGKNVVFENYAMTGTSQATAIATGKIVNKMTTKHDKSK